MSVDEKLWAAAAELREDLEAQEPPPFEPNRASPLGGRGLAAAAAVLVLVAGGALFTLGRNDDSTAVETVDPPAASTTTVDTADGDGPASTSPPSPSPSPIAGPLPEGVTDQRDVPVQPMDRPDGAPAAEVGFGTSVRRITSSAPGEVTTPVFSGTQAFNSDGSRILLYRTGGDRNGHVLLDGDTFAELAVFDIPSVDIEDLNWDHEDPALLHYLAAGTNRIETLDLSDPTDVTTSVMHRFDDCDTAGTGTVSGTTTAGTSLLAVICYRDGEASELVAFDLDARIELGRAPVTGDEVPIATPSGERFVLIEPEAIRVFDRRLEPVEPGIIYRGVVSSAVTASGPDGADVVVVTLFSDDVTNGSVIVIDVATGQRTDVVAESSGYGYPLGGSQLAVAAADRPSVVVATSQPDEGAGLLVDEIIVVDLGEPEPVVHRLAHHRMSRGEPFGPWSRANVAISPDGSRVLFASDWRTGEAVDTYLID